MFSVTQALREWIYELIPRLVEAGPNITEEKGMTVVKSVKTILTQYIETEMKEINQLFSQVEIKDKKFKTPGCEDATEDDVNPIMAAFDWEKCKTYDVLAERGVRILSSAFKMAFPTGNTKKDSKNITGCNVERIDDFRQYISEQYNKFNKVIDSPELSLLAIRNLVGVNVQIDSTHYETIKSLQHTPVLFPSRLETGDIIVIYDKQGCTIARFIKYYPPEEFKRQFLVQEEMEMAVNEPDRKINKHTFISTLRAICYSLDQDDTVAEAADTTSRLFIHNFADIYILYIKPRDSHK
jgi:hypothetical protein